MQYQINPTCLRCNNYGNADYDIRNYFSASYVWQTPWKFGNKFVNGAFGGWTLSQNFFARTGLPLTVLDSTTLHRQLRSGQRLTGLNPVVNNGCSNGQRSCNQYGSGNAINICTALPPLARLHAFPNQIRNSIRGPGFFDSDLLGQQELQAHGAYGVRHWRQSVQRLQPPELRSPGRYLGDGNFGQVLQTTAPPTGPYGSFFAGLPSGRIVQFQGKLVF